MTNEGLLPENKQYTIVPSGIERHQHDMNCRDAGCEEVINMRYKNGAWVTVGEKNQSWAYDHQCSYIYYHPERNTSGTEIYVGYHPGSHKIVSINPSASSSTDLLTLSPSEAFVQFISLNSILVVYTSKTTYMLHYNDDLGNYVRLSREILPQVYFDYEHVDEFTVPPPETSEEENLMQTQQELFNNILIAKHKMRQKGLFCHAYTVVQWAYRLWNGSYVMHSQPVLLRLSDEEAYYTKVHDDSTPTNEVYSCTLRCGRPIFYIDVNATISNNLAKYKGLITHLCVFMSQDISQYLYEYNDTPFDDTGNPGLYSYAFGNNTESLDQLMKMYPLYLAKEIPVNEVIFGLSTTKFEINLNEATNKVNYNGDGGSAVDTVEKIPVRHNTYSWKRLGFGMGENWTEIFRSGIGAVAHNWNKVWYTNEDAEQTSESTDDAGTFALQSQPELPVDEFTHHILMPTARPYVFNSKLHIGNVMTKFFGGYDYSMWNKIKSTNTNDPIAGYTFYREITLETDRGTRIVLDEFTPYNNLYNHPYETIHEITIPNVISYPDARATKIRLVYKYSGDYRLLEEFTLQPHKMYNYSYAITNRMFLSDDTGYLNYGHKHYYLWESNPGLQTETTLETDNRYYEDKNRVQVSSLNNALFYPSRYSYQIGNSANEILCFGSQSAPVSAGQFGQYPLSVFTSQGIFLMQQGSGEVIYAAVVPLNNEIAYKNSVCELGGAMVYASSDGVKMVSGNRVFHLSKPVEGEPSDKLTSDGDYIGFINDISNHLVYLFESLSAENFLDYLSDTVRICFDKINKELIISNRDLFLSESRTYQVPYSYVYNMQYKTWHKIKDSWHDFMMIDSNWYGIRNYRYGYFTGHGMWSMTEETPALMDCMIQSRPMKLGSYDLKKIAGIVQRSLCYVGDPIDSTLSDDDKFGLYMFASMENNLYKFVKGIKVSQPYGMIQSPSLPAAHQSIRHIVLLTAVRSKDFVFSHWEIMSKISMPGKMGTESRKNIEHLIGDYNPDDYHSDYNIEYVEPT